MDSAMVNRTACTCAATCTTDLRSKSAFELCTRSNKELSALSITTQHPGGDRFAPAGTGTLTMRDLVWHTRRTGCRAAPNHRLLQGLCMDQMASADARTKEGDDVGVAQSGVHKQLQFERTERVLGTVMQHLGGDRLALPGRRVDRAHRPVRNGRLL
eukprot:scaffold9455_cov130-Isochrysis_galbana.AAC.2